MNAARQLLDAARSTSPFRRIDTAVEQLDRTKPVVVYCYDYQCDLSPRAAHRLEQLRFAEVYEYVASKVAWLDPASRFLSWPRAWTTTANKRFS
jgi:hypothetical protein